MLNGYEQWASTRTKFDALYQAAALGEGQNLYDANKAVYRLLRYGVKVKEGAGQQNQTVWLIDWEHPENNDFAIASKKPWKRSGRCVSLSWLPVTPKTTCSTSADQTPTKPP